MSRHGPKHPFSYLGFQGVLAQGRSARRGARSKRTPRQVGHTSPPGARTAGHRAGKCSATAPVFRLAGERGSPDRLDLLRHSSRQELCPMLQAFAARPETSTETGATSRHKIGAQNRPTLVAKVSAGDGAVKGPPPQVFWPRRLFRLLGVRGSHRFSEAIALAVHLEDPTALRQTVSRVVQPIQDSPDTHQR